MLQFTSSRYFFYAALRKTLELTKPFSYRVNKASLRVIFVKNHIEKFLIHRQNLCFDSLILDTFFCAALRKTLELTKPFSYRVNKTSLRVGFGENHIEKFLIGRQNLCFNSLVLDTYFYAALRKTLELTKPFSYRVNKTSLRVGFGENHIEKFLMGRQNLCFSSLVLDTFFYAALRKTLELTKPFSYRVNKASLRVIFVKNHIEKFLMGRQNLCFGSLVLDTFFLRFAKKNTRTDERLTWTN